MTYFKTFVEADYWLWVMVLASLLWGIRGIFFYPENTKGVKIFFIMGIYQFVFNFVGSLAGWFSAYILFKRLECTAPSFKDLGIVDLILFLVAFLGLTGHLPQVLYTAIRSIERFVSLMIDKITPASGQLQDKGTA